MSLKNKIHTSGLGRECAVEAVRYSIHRPPGCRQGTSLELMVWHYCPAAKWALRALGILD